MKKAALLFIVILASLTGLFLWVRGQASQTDSARLLPEDTAFYAVLTDLPRSALRWKKTTLARIAAEPEVADFLAKPLGALVNDAGGKEAFDILSDLKPSRLFVAAFPKGDSGFHLGVGFHFEGGRRAFDGAVARLRQHIAPHAPNPTSESSPDGEMLVSALPNGMTLCSAAQGRWGFLTNHPDALRQMLGRATGRDKSPSLAADASFAHTLSKLPQDPDLAAFLRPGSLLDSLLAIADPGARPDPAQVAQIRQARAVAFGFKMDGADMRDAVFVLRDAPPDTGHLSHSALQITTPQTQGYFAFLFQYEAMRSLLQNPAIQGSLSGHAHDAQQLVAAISEALGEEAAIALSWPADRMIPEVLAAVQVRDPEKFQAVLEQLTAFLPETTRTEKGDISLYSFPSLRYLFMDPVLAFSGNFVVAGLSSGDVETVLPAGSNAGTLKDNPAFPAALPAFQAANESFGFLDTKGLFERAYPLARQIAMLGSALLPKASGFWDPAKIPPTETIARHLTPIVYSQTRLPDGYLIESSGPVTMDQAALVAAGAFLGPRLLPKTR